MQPRLATGVYVAQMSSPLRAIRYNGQSRAAQFAYGEPGTGFAPIVPEAVNLVVFVSTRRSVPTASRTREGATQRGKTFFLRGEGAH